MNQLKLGLFSQEKSKRVEFLRHWIKFQETKISMGRDLNLIVYRIHRGEHLFASSLPYAIDEAPLIGRLDTDLGQKRVLRSRETHLCTFHTPKSISKFSYRSEQNQRNRTKLQVVTAIGSEDTRNKQILSCFLHFLDLQTEEERGRES